MYHKRVLFFLIGAAALVTPLSARAQNGALTAYPAGPGARYSGGVKIAAGTPLYFPSGSTAGKDAGNTVKDQAATIMGKLKDNITAAGFTLADVAFVRAYLAPSPDGSIDFDGWNAAWDDVFNQPAQVYRPARTTIGLPALGSPTTLVEIEFVCAAPGTQATFAAQGLPVSNSRLKLYGAKEARIAAGVGVAAGSALYWTAGTTAGKGGGTDTKSQAITTLTKLKENLQGAGLSFKDVVFLRALVAPDPAKEGTYDLAGWNEGYSQFFNSADQPHKPARTSIPVEPFGGDTMVEIEIIAAYPGAPAGFESTKDANASLKTYGAATSAIASGVAVAENRSFYFSAGAVSSVDGDVKTQALSALETLKNRLGEAGMSFQDVTFLRAYIVPEANGAIDRKGWSEAYGTYFNTPTSPHKPTRTTFAVKALPKASAKIEIDVIAASSK